MMPRRFYQIVMDTSAEDDPEVARRGTGAVLKALRDRLTSEEADQVQAQLPSELKEMWATGDAVDRRPIKMHRAEFYERVKREVGLGSVAQARWITLGVFAALKEQLSPGEAEDVLAQLPKDLKEVWAEAQAKV